MTERTAGRPFAALIVAGALWSSAASASASADIRPMLTVDEFFDTFGVNVHMAYADTAYGSPAKVRDALRYLGVRHLRDIVRGDGKSADHGGKAIEFLGREGYRLNMILSSGRSAEEHIAVLERMEAAAPGAIAAIEGYNEINNFGEKFKGEDGLSVADRGMRENYAAIKAHPKFSDIPVYDMTGQDVLRKKAGLGPEGLDDIRGRADLANIHPYPQNGRQPGGWIKPDLINDYALPPDFPKVITEFGYASLPQSGWLVIGVDENTQAKGVLNGLLDAARAGYERTYVYELLDQKPDPKGVQREHHFGLFTHDYQPKRIAVGIHNLRNLLVDQAVDGGPASTPELEDSGGSDQASMRALDLQTNAGGLATVLWREPDFWDRETGKPIQAPPIDVAVDYTVVCARISTAMPLDQDGWSVVAEQSGTAEIPVADAPVLVRCE